MSHKQLPPAANHSSVGDDDARRGRDSDRATADAIHEKLEHDGGNPVGAVATLSRSRWMWWASLPFAAFPPSGERNAASEAIAVYSDIEKLRAYANGAEAAGGRVWLRLRSGVWARWSGWVKSIQSDTTVTNHEQRILDRDDVLQWVLIHDN